MNIIDNDVTEIVVVLDKSGSMNKIKDDAIGGFNEFLKGQQEIEGSANLTLILFDTKYKTLYKGAPIQEVEPLNENTFVPGGWTALLDAAGIAIHETKERLANDPSAKVIIAILTDGKENRSEEYERSQLFDMINEQKEKGWEFLFLGANQNAIEVGGSIGITADKSFTYMADSIGTRGAHRKYGAAIAGFRATGSISDEKWKDA